MMVKENNKADSLLKRLRFIEMSGLNEDKIVYELKV